MERKYWDSGECLPFEKLRRRQLKNLKKTLKLVYGCVQLYHEKFQVAGLKPKDIKSLEDIQRLSFTVKTDLRDNYPFGLWTIPRLHKDLARVHASSGTTGKPITGPYTKNDMAQWAECMARGLWAAGIGEDDLAQNALGMGLFTGGLGFLLGAERIGCAIIPSGSGMTERQVMLIQDLKPTVLFCTPSYALTIADKAEKMGINPTDFFLRVGVFGAEPWSDAMRDEIEKRLGIMAHEAYGLTELMGPGVAFSCWNKQLHINEDHVFPEIIDPKTGEVLPLGIEGELVLTSLQREAMPMIRYRTRDITTLRREKCSCGRTLITMDRVARRSDDMKIVNGVNIFPSQFESILLQFEELEPFYTIILTKKERLDAVMIYVETKGDVNDSALEDKISKRIKETIGISAHVSLKPLNVLPRSEGKAKRLIDEREMK